MEERTSHHAVDGGEGFSSAQVLASFPAFVGRSPPRGERFHRSGTSNEEGLPVSSLQPHRGPIMSPAVPSAAPVSSHQSRNSSPRRSSEPVFRAAADRALSQGMVASFFPLLRRLAASFCCGSASAAAAITMAAPDAWGTAVPTHLVLLLVRFAAPAVSPEEVRRAIIGASSLIIGSGDSVDGQLPLLLQQEECESVLRAVSTGGDNHLVEAVLLTAGPFAQFLEKSLEGTVPLASVVSPAVADALHRHHRALRALFDTLCDVVGAADTCMLFNFFAHRAGSRVRMFNSQAAVELYFGAVELSEALTFSRMLDRVVVLAAICLGDNVDGSGSSSFSGRADQYGLAPATVGDRVNFLCTLAFGGPRATDEDIKRKVDDGLGRALSDNRVKLAEVEGKVERHVLAVFLHYCAAGDISGVSLMTLKKFRRFVKDAQALRGRDERFIDDIFLTTLMQAQDIDPRRYPNPALTKGMSKQETAQQAMTFKLFLAAIEAIARLEGGYSETGFVDFVSSGTFCSQFVGRISPKVMHDVAADSAMQGALAEYREPLKRFFSSYTADAAHGMTLVDIKRWVADASLVPAILSTADISRVVTRTFLTCVEQPYDPLVYGVPLYAFEEIVCLLALVGRGLSTMEWGTAFRRLLVLMAVEDRGVLEGRLRNRQLALRSRLPRGGEGNATPVERQRLRTAVSPSSSARKTPTPHRRGSGDARHTTPSQRSAVVSPIPLGKLGGDGVGSGDTPVSSIRRLAKEQQHTVIDMTVPPQQSPGRSALAAPDSRSLHDGFSTALRSSPRRDQIEPSMSSVALLRRRT